MAGIQLDVRMPQDFQRRWRVFQSEIKPQKLLQAVGESWIREINDTFKREGRANERWAPLKPGTIEGRKKGPGKHGAKVLQDRGTLRASFNPGKTGSAYRLTDKFVTVGTNIEYASFHEKGTKGGKQITPGSGKKALTIPDPSGPAKFTKGKLKGKRGFFAKSAVPGPIPARPMLPTARTAQGKADKVLAKLIRNAARKVNR